MNSNLCPTPFTYKDLLLRKLYYSVVCSVLSQLVILQIYVFITNFNPLHPIDWILSVFRTFTTLSTWLFVLPFMTIIFAQSIICAKDYVFKSSYCSTRFQKFISLVSMHNLVLLLLNILVGSNLIWLFLSLGNSDYRNMTYECTKGTCLNEGAFFLVVSGFWSGLYYFLKVYISEKHLSFPVIHQRKVLQLKAQVLPLLRESFTLSYWPMVYYAFIYYTWGSQFSKDFSSILGFHQEESVHTSFIYMQLWTFGAIYYFNMSLMRFFFNLFLTEPVAFPLVKETTDSLCLQESLNMSNLPIVQSLACLDLYQLAQWSKCRRQVFFSLSQPGGHPHNWNLLVENVLKLLNEYKELLNKSSDGSDVITSSVAPVAPVNTIIRPLDRYRNLRNMSLLPPEPNLDIVEITQEMVPVQNFPKIVLEKLQTKLQNVLSVVKVVFGINFMFGELPQANVQKCLANGHLIIWSSQGISDLACISIVEDRYGIVQKDLPGIITALVQVKQSLDRLNKVPALARKLAGYDDFNYRMKGAITAAVKRSLFNICRTFGSYMNEFPLSKDVTLYLQTIYKY